MDFGRFVRRAVPLVAIGVVALPLVGAADGRRDVTGRRVRPLAPPAQAPATAPAPAAAPAPAGSARAPAPAPSPVPPPVTISGHLLLRGGVPWTPRGFVMVAALSPTRSGAGGRAFANLSDGAMQAARSWGADSLRFQVSQRGLDPQDSLYGGDRYVADIRAAVDLASAHGFNVILSVQDQSLSGGTAHPQPSPATARAWGTLTAGFNGRPDIMYELFNEPQNHDGAAGWAVWRDGGPAADNQGDPAIGHQPLLDYVRSTGATNVVIVDGGRWGGSLKGVPLLHDPLGQLAYGVHPYLANAALDVADWHERFGYLAGTVPVIATEWNAHSSMLICRPEWPQLAEQLVGYLAAHRIGLYGWAFDVPNSLVKDWSRNPTSFEGYQCGVSGGGAGELVRAYFLGDSPPVPPPPGQPPPGQPPPGQPPPGQPPLAPPAGRPPVLSFGPSADATVRSSDPARNFGTDALLRADRGPGAAMEGYLRFDVRGLQGPVARAVLRLYVVRGSATGPSVFRTANGWKESGREGITWARRPDRRGGPLAALGAAAEDRWVEYDVTAAVNGNGTFSFVLATGSIDGTDFSSRQNVPARRPQLVVTQAR